MIILHKKGRETLKITGPSVYFPHIYKLFTWVLQRRMEWVLDESQPREQAGFRKGYSTVDLLQTINQLIKKCNGFKRPLCIGCTDYVRIFDSIEHEAIFKALRSIGINETYIQEDNYTEATARVHMDSQVSKEIPIQRGIKQGDPVSPKLFTATIQEVFKMPS